MRIIVRMPRFLPVIDVPITIYHGSDAIFVDESTGEVIRADYLHLYYYPASPLVNMAGIISYHDAMGYRILQPVKSVVFESNSVPVISFFD